MPFVSRRDLALSAQKAADRKHREQLRQALSTPGLTLEQRRDLERRLGQVGQPRVYDAASPPPPGAIKLPAPAPKHTEEELMGKKKTELVALATEEGLPSTGTKAQLVERLLSR
jgi:hypothetical protein